MAAEAGDGATRDFFISRAGNDSDVALVIANILREAGCTTFLQDEDFGHTSFMKKMRDGFDMVEDGARVVTLLSRPYMASDYCMAEAEYALTGDPSNDKGRLIVLRVEECQPTGFLKPIPYVDLVPLMNDAEKFARAVLGAVDPVKHPKDADFAQLYRRSGKQILHPEVRAVPGFAARGVELSTLNDLLWKKSGRAAVTNSQNATAAVKGMGGVGKSVLAQQYAWVNREKYAGVWWVRAETEETLLDDLVELGVRLIDKSIGEIPDRHQAAGAVLDEITQRQHEKPWLIVYDNVENPDAIDKLTPANGAHVLITTRWSDWYGHAEELPVDVFPRDTAVAFLMERARGSDTRADEVRAEAGQLADDLGCLPLALAVARAQAWKMHWSFAQYREHLAEMLERQPAKGVDYPRSVAATFTLALDQVLETAPEAEKLMWIAAFLAPERIPLDIFPADVMGTIEKGEAVAALAEVSLITPETLEDGTAGFSVHRLVQQVMRGRLGEEAAGAAALATALVAKAYPSGENDPSDVRNWPACRRLEAHAVAVLEIAPDEGDVAQSTSLLAGQYALHLMSRADYAAAEPLYRRALKIDEASFGPDHPNVATSLNNLAELLRETNRLDEAEPMYRRALKIGEASLGGEHTQVAIGLNNLASLLENTNRLDEAEPLYRRALKIGEASLGPDHPNVAIRLNNLAGLLQETNRSGEAEPLYRRALKIDEASFGPDHPNVATSLNNLAELLRETNRLDEAEPMYRRALKSIGEASLGGEHTQVAIGLNNLALLLENTNRLDEAEPLYRRALKIGEASLGPDHPNVAIRLNNLAGLLQETNRSGEAEPLYRRALKIDEASFGPDHPNVATSLNNLAGLLRATNRLDEAEPMFRRALQIFEVSFGSDHPSTKTVRRGLAALLAEIQAGDAGGGAMSPPPAQDDGPVPARIASVSEPSPGDAPPKPRRDMFGWLQRRKE